MSRISRRDTLTAGLGAGLAALLAAREHAELRSLLSLDSGSRVLLLGSEGDTDPEIYQHITGRTAAQVRA